MENTTNTPHGIKITNMETPNSGIHYHEENIAEGKMPATTGASHDELHEEGGQERVICI